MKVYIKKELREPAEHAVSAALQETPYLRHVSFISEPGELEVDGFRIIRKTRDKRVLLVGDGAGKCWWRPRFQEKPPAWFSSYLIHHGALAIDRIDPPEYQHGDCNEAELAWRVAHGRWGQGARGEWSDPVAAVEHRIADLHQGTAEFYIDGASTERSKIRRRDEAETILRLLARLVADLPPPERPETLPSPPDAHVLQTYHVRRLAPWMDADDCGYSLSGRGLWAAAVGMKEGDHWRRITGALLSRAAGHLVQGDARYEELRDMLRRALAEGVAFVAISDGWGYRHDGAQWTRVRIAPRAAGDHDWLEGPIVSRNFGRVMVLPFQDQMGRSREGYTRNAPGEGAAEPRPAPVRIPWRKVRLTTTDAAWLHEHGAILPEIATGAPAVAASA